MHATLFYTMVREKLQEKRREGRNTAKEN